MPFIRPFTIVLNVLKIPSVIPVKISPPLLKTFLTASHALENVFLNQSVTWLKTLVIPFHTPAKNPFTSENAVFIPFHSL